MTTLRIILDEMHGGGSVARYTQELTREIIRIAPHGCYVEGFVSAASETEYASILERLPGLHELHKSALARRELKAAWEHGFTRPLSRGMVHAPSPLAPLSRHDRLNDGDQVSVTFHNALAWTNPDSIDSRTTGWYRAMAKRAQKYADAIVVPSHAVAERLSEFVDFGDRVRVVNGAASTGLTIPEDREDRATALALPERYVVASAGFKASHGLGQLIAAMGRLDRSISLLLIGPGADNATLTNLVVESGIERERVRGLGHLSDEDFATVVSLAAVFAYPQVEESFGMAILDAFSLGTPVVHSDDAALLELGGGAGLAAKRGDGVGYTDRIAESIDSILSDEKLALQMRYAGEDRARIFTWSSAAEQIWQLHADL